MSYLKGRRLRLFGGPNGSGKSTIFRLVDKRFDIGYYINPDNIEKELRTHGYFSFVKYGIKLTEPLNFDEFVASE